jgi:hypothetical protein
VERGGVIDKAEVEKIVLRTTCREDNHFLPLNVSDIMTYSHETRPYGGHQSQGVDMAQVLQGAHAAGKTPTKTTK